MKIPDFYSSVDTIPSLNCAMSCGSLEKSVLVLCRICSANWKINKYNKILPFQWTFHVLSHTFKANTPHDVVSVWSGWVWNSLFSHHCSTNRFFPLLSIIHNYFPKTLHQTVVNWIPCCLQTPFLLDVRLSNLVKQNVFFFFLDGYIA